MRALSPVTLTGRHVRLEPLGVQHLDALCELAAGPRETFALTSVPPTREGMSAYVQAALDLARQGHALPFAIVDAAAERVVGSTRYGSVEYWTWPPGDARQRPRDCPDAVEIGWTWLGPAAQRTGINTEAKLLLLGHAFEALEVHRVSLKTDARNARSRAAIERLGARLDGVLRAHMPGHDGALRDTVFFSMLAGEWPAARDRLRARLRA